MVSTCRYCVASTGIPPVSRRRVRRLSQGRGSGDPRRRRFVPLGASEATFTLSYSGRYSVPRNANMRTYFCLNFSWTRRCGGVSSSALFSEASCIPGRGSTRQGVVRWIGLSFSYFS